MRWSLLSNHRTIDNSIEALKIKPLEVYPNPTNEILSINSENLIGKHLTLIDINGKVVFTFKVTGKLTNLNLSNYSKGIYTLKSENNFTKVVIR